MNSLNKSPDKVKHLGIAAAVLLVSVLAAVFFLSGLADNIGQFGGPHHLPSRQSYFQETEQKGILRASDYARLAQVSDAIQRQHVMSDADLDFWIALLQQGPLKDTPSNRMGFYSIVMGCGVGRKHLTPAQQGKMYDAVLPYVSDTAYAKAIDPTDTHTDPADPLSQQSLRTGAEDIAVILLMETNDPRALSELKSISENSPAPRLRREAGQCHDVLAAARKTP